MGVFDEMRPFRLLHYVRHDWKHPHVPTFSSAPCL
jgi:hypothetical protein